MDAQNNKTVMLRARLRVVDRALLEALCNRRCWNLSEGVRQAITDEAAKEGLYSVAGFIVEREADHEQP